MIKNIRLPVINTDSIVNCTIWFHYIISFTFASVHVPQR